MLRAAAKLRVSVYMRVTNNAVARESGTPFSMEHEPKSPVTVLEYPDVFSFLV